VTLEIGKEGRICSEKAALQCLQRALLLCKLCTCCIALAPHIFIQRTAVLERGKNKSLGEATQAIHLNQKRQCILLVHYKAIAFSNLNRKSGVLQIQGKGTEYKERRAICLCHCMVQGHTAKSDDILWVQVWGRGGHRDVGEELEEDGCREQRKEGRDYGDWRGRTEQRKERGDEQ